MAAISLFAFGVSAQAKRKKTSAKKPATTAAATPTSAAKTEPPPVEASLKKNERPTGEAAPVKPVAAQKTEPAFKYEFTQPDFVTSRIVIEHDEKGLGTISFARRGNDELFTDPLTVSAAAMKRLNDNFDALNFIDSTESYQHAKDFSHLGNIRITVSRVGKSRTAPFNYTENKHAKGLADEYRAIANQAMWVFDITIARENQPLESPNQMKHLESLIKRNEISDPEQMLPFLRGLADDERLPLIARNNATRIVQNIEKAAKKSK